MTAITIAYMMVKYYKRMRDQFDIDDDDAENYTYDELGLYAHFDKLLAKTRNFLWNINPSYREIYEGGEFDTVMAVF
jgi:hypothetical protein